MNMIPNHTHFSHADRELISLGQEFDELLERARPIAAESDRLQDERWDLAEREGVAPSRRLTKEQFERFWEIGRQNGAEAATTAEHEILAEIDAVAKRIRSVRPTTLAGLAVWSRATRFDCLLFDDDVPLNELD